MSYPLISILMTAYNREKFIAEAIESVLASTFADFELIIVDDCSIDSTIEIAKTYERNDARIKVYRNENNLGDYPNRNRAASYAKGKYLKYIDADDYIYPWGLELLIEMMEKFPIAGWGLCSLEQNREKCFPIELNPKEAYEYNYIGPGLFHKAPLSSIIKRETFEKSGGFSSFRMVGDFEMWHRLALNYNVVLMPQGIVWYREHNNQEINSYGHFAAAYEKIIVQYLTCNECPLPEKAIRKLLHGRHNSILFQLIKSFLRVNRKQIKSSWSRLKPYYAK
jgi:glycosyltransferase involved in cell wall biosynthesis